jgi:serine/threonine protein kinase
MGYSHEEIWVPEDVPSDSPLYGYGSSSMKKYCHGVRRYVAPEAMGAGSAFDSDWKKAGTPEGVHASKLDIWAVGGIIYRLATTGRGIQFHYGVEGFGEIDLPQLSDDQNPSFTQATCSLKDGRVSAQQQINSIIKSCLDRDPLKRTTVLKLKMQFEEMKACLLAEHEM